MPEFLELIISEYELLPKGSNENTNVIEWITRHFGNSFHFEQLFCLDLLRQSKEITDLRLCKKRGNTVIFHILYKGPNDIIDQCEILVKPFSKDLANPGKAMSKYANPTSGTIIQDPQPRLSSTDPDLDEEPPFYEVLFI